MRANFSSRVRSLVAARAGYRCSFPECGRSTIGPGAGREETASIGVAAHIYAAAPGGPRGPGHASTSELDSVGNALWLCAKHARIVDANRGDKFPAPVLLSYRDVHEARLSLELEDIATLDGWIEMVKVANAPGFCGPATVRLGKTTIFRGPSGSMKTALCEWLMASLSTDSFGRWTETKHPISLSIRLIAPHRVHEAAVTIDSGLISYMVDDAPSPYIPLNMSVVFVRDVDTTKTMSAKRRLAATLGVPLARLIQLLEFLPKNPGSIVRAARHEKRKLFLDMNGTQAGLPFEALSGSEKVLVTIEFAVANAIFESKFKPTLLIIDSGLGMMDVDTTCRVLRRLAAPALRFQTIAVGPNPNADITGWQAYDFAHGPPVSVKPARL